MTEYQQACNKATYEHIQDRRDLMGEIETRFHKGEISDDECRAQLNEHGKIIRELKKEIYA